MAHDTCNGVPVVIASSGWCLPWMADTSIMGRLSGDVRLIGKAREKAGRGRPQRWQWSD